jgi:pre-rRNA-processing protein TSR3
MLKYEIIVDHGESSNKCTILPLTYRPDFRILRGSKAMGLDSEILLHPEGTPLDQLTQLRGTVQTVAAIDCVWRRLDPILRRLRKPLPQAVGIPDGFVTAYPRRSKMTVDPTGGLATIEALFIAAAFIGTWDESLLKEYFSADEFLTLNEGAFIRYGITPPPRTLPVYQPCHTRNSHHRRLARGRFATEKSGAVL